jgi:membrane-associated protease RseP (regulator of RpoE activity)/predicted  nucleic acid-binding Zn-ribbon protein
MPKGVYECIRCGHREVIDSNEPLLEGACPKCGGDMILVGYIQEEKAGETAEVEERPEVKGPALPKDVEDILRSFYSIRFLEFNGNTAIFEVEEILKNDFESLLRKLEGFGYWAALKKREGKVLLFVFPSAEIKPDNPWLPWIFLISTIATTFFSGYVLAKTYIATLDYYGLPGLRNPYLIALAFSVSVMAILGTHEMGHKIAAAYHGVKATMPYFIPFPFSLIGTLGAVIRVKSPLPTRNAAIDLGVSGPIAGFVVAVPVTMLGLKMSVVVPPALAPPSKGGVYFGTNLLFELLMKAVLGVPKDYVVFLHPIAIAGWVGILVTFLNLIPVAQLDGGHILRAFISERAHRFITLAVAFLLFGLGYLWPGWFIWGLLVLLIGLPGNPGALDEVSPITKSRIILAIIAGLIFLLTATPRPLWSS